MNLASKVQKAIHFRNVLELTCFKQKNTGGHSFYDKKKVKYSHTCWQRRNITSTTSTQVSLLTKD